MVVTVENKNDNVSPSLFAFVYDYMKKERVSIAEMAARMGMTNAGFRALLKSGNTNLIKLKKLAKACGGDVKLGFEESLVLGVQDAELIRVVQEKNKLIDSLIEEGKHYEEEYEKLKANNAANGDKKPSR